MDLKFTFSSTPPQSHEHNTSTNTNDSDASGQQPEPTRPLLPLSTATSSTSGVSANALTIQISLGEGTVEGIGLSADGVNYGSASKHVVDHSAATLAAATRSVLARTAAELPEPLIQSISAISLSLRGAETAVLSELSLEINAAADSRTSPISATDMALQARTGVTAGTPISIQF